MTPEEARAELGGTTGDWEDWQSDLVSKLIDLWEVAEVATPEEHSNPGMPKKIVDQFDAALQALEQKETPFARRYMHGAWAPKQVRLDVALDDTRLKHHWELSLLRGWREIPTHWRAEWTWNLWTNRQWRLVLLVCRPEEAQKETP